MENSPASSTPPTGEAPRHSRDAAVLALQRPHENLLKVYLIQALCTVFGFPFVILPLYFKYQTLRYRFDEEGVNASWGILFRREIYLTYRRIQDINVRRNLFERWLGLATIEVQTASGSSSAELTLEGLRDYSAVRDFLYRRMRGAAAEGEEEGEDTSAGAPPAGEARVVELLEGIRAELDKTRAALQGRS